jgi:hypothetical protein
MHEAPAPVSRLRGLVPAAVIVLLALLFFAPVLLGGKTFLALDTLNDYYPWRAVPGYTVPENRLISDPVNMAYVFHSYIAEHLKQGDLPLWDSRLFSGMPVAATELSRYGNPLWVLLSVLLSPLAFHDFFLWLALTGAGLFMYFYLKSLGLGTLPRLFGAVAWMFTGCTIVWFEFESFPLLAATFPAMLLCFELWLASRRLPHAMALTAAAATAVSSGFAHLLMYQFAAAGAYMVFRLIQTARGAEGPRFGKREFLSAALALVLVLLCSAVFLQGNLAVLGNSQRESYPFDTLFEKTGQVPARFLVTLLFPDFYGNPAIGVAFVPMKTPTQVYNNYNELCLYLGIAPLLLAVAGLTALRRRPAAPFFLALAAFALASAMGSAVYYPLYKLFPGLNFSTPTRILSLFGFAMAVLSAFGMEALLTAGKTARRIVLALWLLILAAGLGMVFFVWSDAGPEFIGAMTRPVVWENVIKPYCKALYSPGERLLFRGFLFIGLTFPLAAACLLAKRANTRTVLAWCLAGAAALDLMAFGLAYNTASPKGLLFRETPGLRFLKEQRQPFRAVETGDQFLLNCLAPFGIESPIGYSSLYPRRYGEYMHIAQFGDTRPMPDNFSRWMYLANFGSTLYDMLNVKYLIAPMNARIAGEQIKTVYDGEVKILENPQVLPRAFFTGSYGLCGDDATMHKALAAMSYEVFKTTVLLSSPPPDSHRDLTAPAGPMAITPEFLAREPDRVTVRFTSPAKGFLVLGDGYHEGWKARINGKPAPVLRANHVLRAVPVFAGEQTVEFAFEPGGTRAALCATWTGWALVPALACGAFAVGRRRRA